MAETPDVFVLDDVSYRITAKPIPGGYSGQWRCSACGATGSSSQTSPTPESAAIDAEVNLGGHHWGNHRPGGVR